VRKIPLKMEYRHANWGRISCCWASDY